MTSAEDDLPPPVRLINGEGASPYVLICEHASRHIPRRFAGLGLPETELRRHIAWDIGAEAVALTLSRLLDAPLFLAGYSRLLIDLNRPVDSDSSIPLVSERTDIPGNLNLTDEDRAWRIDTLFTPFHGAIAGYLDARQRQTRPTALATIHSFTPVYKDVARPWHAGILFRKSMAFGEALVQALGGADAHVAANQPYQISDGGDYAIPVHGEARGLEAVLVELRQDLITHHEGADAWALRLAKALAVTCPV
jgi:predicted N-formylglutamate amidohydrolase